MRAVIQTRYGPPESLEIGELPKPEPRVGEVVVRVRATTVNRTDCGNLRGKPFVLRFFMGFPRPKRPTLGMDFAGEIDAVGAGVTAFKPGDRVFGMSPREYGAHAEYLRVSTRWMATTPTGIAFREAVVCEGAFYADTILQKLGVGPGHRMLIYGASGAIGTAAVQLAKAAGAEVTAVAGTQHLELVKSLGADRAIDYTAGDFTQIGDTFDSVVDAVGKTTYFRCRRLLKPAGIFTATDMGPWGQNVCLTLWSSITGSRRHVFPVGNPRKDFAAFLKARMEKGELRAVIDREYPLDAIVDAYRYVETQQKTGIVVVNV